MSSLQNLIDKVKSDANAACEKILAENKMECDKIIAARVKAADTDYKDIIEKANNDALVLHDRMVSSEELKIRNKKLKTKQETIEKIIGELYNKLLNLDEKEYLQYLKNGLSTVSEVDGGMVIVSEKYKKSSAKIIKDKGNNFEISEETLKGNNGFMVIKDKVTMDFTYLKVIEFYKEDLEKIIVEQLFS